jgi:hypothetical protein
VPRGVASDSVKRVHNPQPIEQRHAHFCGGRILGNASERGYKDKSGNWKSTSSFSPEEWEVVHGLLAQAKGYVELALAKAAERQAAAAEEAEPTA